MGKVVTYLPEKIIVHDLSSDFETLEIYPLVDLHIGDKKTDIPLFHKFIAHILDKPNRFITIQGDLMNNATKSSVSNVYEETMNPQEQKKWLIHELKCIKNRILCVVPGNHEQRSTKDVDNHPLEDLAIALDIEHLYRPDGAFLKISFGKNHGKNAKKTAYTLCCVHGSGGGSKPGAAANRIEDFLYSLEGVDILVMGHVHKKIAGRPAKTVVDPHNNYVTQRDVLWVIAAPWQEYGGYAFRKMLRPSPKGKTPIILYGKEKYFETVI
jgi:UDP-2,3-diacylglucosamine pyrophosphatase LpxH